MFAFLLTHSWQLFTRHFRALLIGALVFALMYSAMVHNTSKAITNTMQYAIGSSLLTPEVYEDLKGQARAGELDATRRYMRQVNKLSESYLALPAEQRQQYINQQARAVNRSLLPAFLFFGFVTALIALLAGSYYLVVFLRDHNHPLDAFFDMWKYLPPLLMLGLYALLLSGLWLPVLLPGGLKPLGLLIAVGLCLVVLPRLCLVPIVVVREKSSAYRALGWSRAVTKGHIGRIIVAGIAGDCLLMVVQFCTGTVLHVLTFIPNALVPFLSSLMKLLLLAFAVAYLLAIHKYIQKHPAK